MMVRKKRRRAVLIGVMVKESLILPVIRRMAWLMSRSVVVMARVRILAISKPKIWLGRKIRGVRKMVERMRIFWRLILRNCNFGS